jgi:excisionase family DNA binding protein
MALAKSEAGEDRRELAISVAQTAELLGLSTASVYHAVQRGDIPSIRIGGRILIGRVAVERMLAGSEDAQR